MRLFFKLLGKFVLKLYARFLGKKWKYFHITFNLWISIKKRKNSAPLVHGIPLPLAPLVLFTNSLVHVHLAELDFSLFYNSMFLHCNFFTNRFRDYWDLLQSRMGSRMASSSRFSSSLHYCYRWVQSTTYLVMTYLVITTDQNSDDRISIYVVNTSDILY